MAQQRVRVGIEVLRDSGFKPLSGKRVGLLTNPSAVDGDLTSTYDILRNAPQMRLSALFGPEHGFAGVARDGEAVSSGTDPRTGLPVYSLYGATKRPTREMLVDLDCIVCDIQDIGVRYYTYVWTISHLIEAAGEYGVEVIILDRPNPLGNVVDGAPLDQQFASLVGRYPVPTRHGMTLGELAQMFNKLWNPHPAALSVIPCDGYRPGMTWAETGLVFVPPSPNMPHVVTVQHYPGSCLVEGTSLSEGRGTALPFEILGAPGLDGSALAERLNAQGWAGVKFRTHLFKPTTGKFAGDSCGGVQAHILDPASYHPVEVWLRVLSIIREQLPFIWNDHFERLLGVEGVRARIEAGESLEGYLLAWRAFCEEFRQQRQPFLIY